MKKILTGIVVRGKGRGRGLGFPTANLALDAGVTRPPDGIYAAWADASGTRATAAVHVGPVPTFGDAIPTIEVHLLDFPDRDLYDMRLTVELIARLRDVTSFRSAADLAYAIQRDIEQVRRLLFHPRPSSAA